MKKKQLVTTAALLVAFTLAAPSAFAITATQAKAVKKAVTSVPVAEMPAKAAELVSQASKEDREAVALTAVRAAIYKSRASAPLVVSAVVKAAPEFAASVSMAAAEMEAGQAGYIAHAASQAAPEAKSEIQASVSRGVETGALTRPSFASTRSAAGGGGGGPTVNNVPNPINLTSGGSGNGSYVGAIAKPTVNPPVIKDYKLPRTQ